MPVKINVTWEGIGQMEAYFKALPPKIPAAIRGSIDDVTQAFKDVTPVGTARMWMTAQGPQPDQVSGTLRDSTKIEYVDMGWLYTNAAKRHGGVIYASFVNFGTSKMSGRHFAEKGLDKGAQITMEAMAGILK